MMFWEDVRLGDLFEIKHGWAFKGEFFRSEGDLIVVTPGNFFEQGGFKVRPGKEKFYLGKFPDEYLLKRNDIVIAMTEQGPGLLGSPGLIPVENKFLHNQRIGLITNIKADRIFDRYIYYLFFTSGVRNEIFGSATGTKVKHTAPKRIYQIKVQLPPLLIQREIASILSCYDELIDNNFKRIKLLSELAKIQFKKFNEEELHFNEFELCNLTEFLGRGVTPVYEDGSGFWAINQKANKGMFLEEQHFKEYKIGDWVPKEKFAKNGDILINCLGEGTLGRCHYYKWEDDIYPVDQHITIFRGKTKEVSLYVYLFLDSDEGQGVLYSLKKGGTNMTMLNINDLRSIKIRLPSEVEMSNLYLSIEPLFAQKASLEKQNRLLKEARDILLPKLMNAKISVDSLTKNSESKMILFGAESGNIDSARQKEKAVKWEFKEAVLIAMLIQRFGSENFPLGRKRYTKLSYLFHRHVDNEISRYQRKAAGPYNPETKYKGPEQIIQKNGYAKKQVNGKLQGFVAGKKIAEAQKYFEKYWSMSYLDWLEQFRYKTNDELELYATVDHAILELIREGKDISVKAIKAILRKEPEWKAKLMREIFGDKNIQIAVDYLSDLFPSR